MLFVFGTASTVIVNRKDRMYRIGHLVLEGLKLSSSPLLLLLVKYEYYHFTDEESAAKGSPVVSNPTFSERGVHNDNHSNLLVKRVRCREQNSPGGSRTNNTSNTGQNNLPETYKKVINYHLYLQNIGFKFQ